MVIREKVTIPSLTGNEERTSYVYLPVGYKEDGAGYPVLYMFDGHNLFTDEEATFGKCWGIEKYFDENKVPLIVAAVECNHCGTERLSEYSPQNFYFRGERIVGKGKKYMDWLTTEFKTLVDFKYNTLPDRKNTFIAGSSMGGLMTVYALVKYGAVFSRGAALSPSLWVQQGEMPSFIQNAKLRRDVRLFTDYGEKEFKNHAPQKNLFASFCGLMINDGVLLTSRIVPGGVHSETSWEKEIPYFLPVLLGN